MSILNINIADCVHYRGFRYGGLGNNIYEDYVISVHAEPSASTRRTLFVRRVLAYQGEVSALTIKPSSFESYFPWDFPWSFSCLRLSRRKKYDAVSNPDIICHVATDGVLSSHINREFFWLENAYKNMRSGYTPHTNGFITVQKLEYQGMHRYLVLDGNHRLASLFALGYSTVECQIRPKVITDRSIQHWPGVFFRKFSVNEAVTIFQKYFQQSNAPLPEVPHQKLISDVPLLI